MSKDKISNPEHNNLIRDKAAKLVKSASEKSIPTTKKVRTNKKLPDDLPMAIKIIPQAANAIGRFNQIDETIGISNFVNNVEDKIDHMVENGINRVINLGDGIQISQNFSKEEHNTPNQVSQHLIVVDSIPTPNFQKRTVKIPLQANGAREQQFDIPDALAELSLKPEVTPAGYKELEYLSTLVIQQHFCHRPHTTLGCASIAQEKREALKAWEKLKKQTTALRQTDFEEAQKASHSLFSAKGEQEIDFLDKMAKLLNQPLPEAQAVAVDTIPFELDISVYHRDALLAGEFTIEQMQEYRDLSDEDLFELKKRIIQYEANNLAYYNKILYRLYVENTKTFIKKTPFQKGKDQDFSNFKERLKTQVNSLYSQLQKTTSSAQRLCDIEMAYRVRQKQYSGEMGLAFHDAKVRTDKIGLRYIHPRATKAVLSSLNKEITHIESKQNSLLARLSRYVRPLNSALNQNKLESQRRELVNFRDKIQNHADNTIIQSDLGKLLKDKDLRSRFIEQLKSLRPQGEQDKFTSRLFKALSNKKSTAQLIDARISEFFANPDKRVLVDQLTNMINRLENEIKNAGLLSKLFSTKAKQEKLLQALKTLKAKVETENIAKRSLSFIAVYETPAVTAFIGKYNKEAAQAKQPQFVRACLISIEKERESINSPLYKLLHRTSDVDGSDLLFKEAFLKLFNLSLGDEEKLLSKLSTTDLTELDHLINQQMLQNLNKQSFLNNLGLANRHKASFVYLVEQFALQFRLGTKPPQLAALERFESEKQTGNLNTITNNSYLEPESLLVDLLMNKPCNEQNDKQLILEIDNLISVVRTLHEKSQDNKKAKIDNVRMGLLLLKSVVQGTREKIFTEEEIQLLENIVPEHRIRQSNEAEKYLGTTVAQFLVQKYIQHVYDKNTNPYIQEIERKNKVVPDSENIIDNSEILDNKTEISRNYRRAQAQVALVKAYPLPTKLMDHGKKIKDNSLLDKLGTKFQRQLFENEYVQAAEVKSLAKEHLKTATSEPHYHQINFYLDSYVLGFPQAFALRLLSSGGFPFVDVTSYQISSSKQFINDVSNDLINQGFLSSKFSTIWTLMSDNNKDDSNKNKIKDEFINHFFADAENSRESLFISYLKEKLGWNADVNLEWRSLFREKRRYEKLLKKKQVPGGLLLAEESEELANLTQTVNEHEEKLTNLQAKKDQLRTLKELHSNFHAAVRDFNLITQIKEVDVIPASQELNYSAAGRLIRQVGTDTQAASYLERMFEKFTVLHGPLAEDDSIVNQLNDYLNNVDEIAPKAEQKWFLNHEETKRGEKCQAVIKRKIGEFIAKMQRFDLTNTTEDFIKAYAPEFLAIYQYKKLMSLLSQLQEAHETFLAAEEKTKLHAKLIDKLGLACRDYLKQLVANDADPLQENDKLYTLLGSTTEQANNLRGYIELELKLRHKKQQDEEKRLQHSSGDFGLIKSGNNIDFTNAIGMFKTYSFPGQGYLGHLGAVVEQLMPLYLRMEATADKLHNLIEIAFLFDEDAQGYNIDRSINSNFGNFKHEDYDFSVLESYLKNLPQAIVKDESLLKKIQKKLTNELKAFKADSKPISLTADLFFRYFGTQEQLEEYRLLYVEHLLQRVKKSHRNPKLLNTLNVKQKLYDSRKEINEENLSVELGDTTVEEINSVLFHKTKADLNKLFGSAPVIEPNAYAYGKVMKQSEFISSQERSQRNRAKLDALLAQHLKVISSVHEVSIDLEDDNKIKLESIDNRVNPLIVNMSERMASESHVQKVRVAQLEEYLLDTPTLTKATAQAFIHNFKQYYVNGLFDHKEVTAYAIEYFKALEEGKSTYTQEAQDAAYQLILFFCPGLMHKFVFERLASLMKQSGQDAVDRINALMDLFDFDVNLPTMKLNIPQVSKIELPTINIPAIMVPQIKLPTIVVPQIKLPTISIPQGFFDSIKGTLESLVSGAQEIAQSALDTLKVIFRELKKILLAMTENMLDAWFGLVDGLEDLIISLNDDMSNLVDVLRQLGNENIQKLMALLRSVMNVRINLNKSFKEEKRNPLLDYLCNSVELQDIAANSLEPAKAEVRQLLATQTLRRLQANVDPRTQDLIAMVGVDGGGCHYNNLLLKADLQLPWQPTQFNLDLQMFLRLDNVGYFTSCLITLHIARICQTLPAEQDILVQQVANLINARPKISKDKIFHQVEIDALFRQAKLLDLDTPYNDTLEKAIFLYASDELADEYRLKKIKLLVKENKLKDVETFLNRKDVAGDAEQKLDYMVSQKGQENLEQYLNQCVKEDVEWRPSVAALVNTLISKNAATTREYNRKRMLTTIRSDNDNYNSLANEPLPEGNVRVTRDVEEEFAYLKEDNKQAYAQKAAKIAQHLGTVSENKALQALFDEMLKSTLDSRVYNLLNKFMQEFDDEPEHFNEEKKAQAFLEKLSQQMESCPLFNIDLGTRFGFSSNEKKPTTAHALFLHRLVDSFTYKVQENLIARKELEKNNPVNKLIFLATAIERQKQLRQDEKSLHEQLTLLYPSADYMAKEEEPVRKEHIKKYVKLLNLDDKFENALPPKVGGMDAQKHWAVSCTTLTVTLNGMKARILKQLDSNLILLLPESNTLIIDRDSIVKEDFEPDLLSRLNKIKVQIDGKYNHDHVRENFYEINNKLALCSELRKAIKQLYLTDDGCASFAQGLSSTQKSQLMSSDLPQAKQLAAYIKRMEDVDKFIYCRVNNSGRGVLLDELFFLCMQQDLYAIDTEQKRVVKLAGQYQQLVHEWMTLPVNASQNTKAVELLECFIGFMDGVTETERKSLKALLEVLYLDRKGANIDAFVNQYCTVTYKDKKISEVIRKENTIVATLIQMIFMGHDKYQRAKPAEKLNILRESIAAVITGKGYLWTQQRSALKKIKTTSEAIQQQAISSDSYAISKVASQQLVDELAIGLKKDLPAQHAILLDEITWVIEKRQSVLSTLLNQINHITSLFAKNLSNTELPYLMIDAKELVLLVKNLPLNYRESLKKKIIDFKNASDKSNGLFKLTDHLRNDLDSLCDYLDGNILDDQFEFQWGIKQSQYKNRQKFYQDFVAFFNDPQAWTLEKIQRLKQTMSNDDDGLLGSLIQHQFDTKLNQNPKNPLQNADIKIYKELSAIWFNTSNLLSIDDNNVIQFSAENEEAADLLADNRARLFYVGILVDSKSKLSPLLDSISSTLEQGLPDARTITTALDNYLSWSQSKIYNIGNPFVIPKAEKYRNEIYVLFYDDLLKQLQTTVDFLLWFLKLLESKLSLDANEQMLSEEFSLAEIQSKLVQLYNNYYVLDAVLHNIDVEYKIAKSSDQNKLPERGSNEMVIPIKARYVKNNETEAGLVKDGKNNNLQPITDYIEDAKALLHDKAQSQLVKLADMVQVRALTELQDNDFVQQQDGWVEQSLHDVISQIGSIKSKSKVVAEEKQQVVQPKPLIHTESAPTLPMHTPVASRKLSEADLLNSNIDPKASNQHAFRSTAGSLNTAVLDDNLSAKDAVEKLKVQSQSVRNPNNYSQSLKSTSAPSAEKLELLRQEREQKEYMLRKRAKKQQKKKELEEKQRLAELEKQSAKSAELEKPSENSDLVVNKNSIPQEQDEHKSESTNVSENQILSQSATEENLMAAIVEEPGKPVVISQSVPLITKNAANNMPAKPMTRQVGFFGEIIKPTISSAVKSNLSKDKPIGADYFDNKQEGDVSLLQQEKDASITYPQCFDVNENFLSPPRSGINNLPSPSAIEGKSSLRQASLINKQSEYSGYEQKSSFNPGFLANNISNPIISNNPSRGNATSISTSSNPSQRDGSYFPEHFSKATNTVSEKNPPQKIDMTKVSPDSDSDSEFDFEEMTFG